MKNQIMTMTAVMGFMLCAGDLHAQTSYAALPVSAVVSESEAWERAEQLVARGDTLAGERKFASARTAYAAAADLFGSAGILPERSLHSLANLYYLDGRIHDAQRTMERLALEATQHGDVAVQAAAVADAAYLAGMRGDAEAFASSVRILRQLLVSPYLPETQKQRLAERLRD